MAVMDGEAEDRNYTVTESDLRSAWAIINHSVEVYEVIAGKEMIIEEPSEEMKLMENVANVVAIFKEAQKEDGKIRASLVKKRNWFPGRNQNFDDALKFLMVSLKPIKCK